MTVELCLLGPLGAVRDGAEVPLRGMKLRCVLATLALRAGETVSVDRLGDVLWPAAPPRTPMTQIQAQISALRRLLDPEHVPGTAGELIATRPPGYRLDAGRIGIDLREFETAVCNGRDALAAGAWDVASAQLRRGLALWSGRALADLPHERFGADAARLEDLHVTALEMRIEADLELGRHWQLPAELEALCAEHPYRESLWEKLMLALYRCDRQADALAAFRSARAALVEAIGIEPGQRLRDLEQAILVQDARLRASDTSAFTDERRVLVAAEPDRLSSLVELAALFGEGELVAVGHVAADADLVAATALVREAVAHARTPARLRCAAFRTRRVGRDVARLAHEQEAVLVVTQLAADGILPLDLLVACPADVALAAVRELASLDGVAVPFTGTTHDWAALALAGRLAAVRRVPLQLVGIDTGGAGDASRALANAALAVQRVAGVDATPRLVPAGPGALASAAAGAALVMTGVREGYRRGGLGPARLELLRAAPGRIVLVHAGPRPGALAPAASSTRFTWSLAGAAA